MCGITFLRWGMDLWPLFCPLDLSPDSHLLRGLLSQCCVLVQCSQKAECLVQGMSSLTVRVLDAIWAKWVLTTHWKQSGSSKLQDPPATQGIHECLNQQELRSWSHDFVVCLNSEQIVTVHHILHMCAYAVHYIDQLCSLYTWCAVFVQY